MKAPRPDGPLLAPPRTVIGLGTNLGDRLGTLEGALREIAELGGVRALGRSSIWRTAPVAPPEALPQPDFYNAAVVVRSSLPPIDLLHALLAIERRYGRARSTPNAPRTLDLDILWIEGVVVDEQELAVPHPRLHQRAFALIPLLEVAGDAKDPRTGAHYRPILEAVGLDGVEKLHPPLDASVA